LQALESYTPGRTYFAIEPELEGLGDLEGLTGPQQVVQSGLQDPPVQVPFVGSLGEVHKIERAGPAEKRNYEELRPN